MLSAKVDRKKQNGHQLVSNREMAHFGLKNAKIFKLAHSIRAHKCHEQKWIAKKNGHQPVSSREMALFGLKHAKIFKLAHSVRSHKFYQQKWIAKKK